MSSMISSTHGRPLYYPRVLFPVLIAAAIAGLITYLSVHSKLGLASGIVFILVGLYPFVRAGIKRDFDAFEIINLFVLYMILGIGVRGLIGIKYGSHFLAYDPGSDHFDTLSLKVFSYSSMALLFLYIGYYSRLGDRWINLLPRLSFDWRKTRALVCLLFYLLLSATAVGFFVLRFGSWGGLKSFGQHPGEFQGQVMLGGMTHITAFMRFFWVVFFASCIYMFSRERPGWGKILFFLCLAGAGFAFIHFGSKSTFLIVLLGYAMARHYLKRKIGMSVFIVLVAGIFILSPFLWHIRAYGINRWDILTSAYSAAAEDPMKFAQPLLQRSYSFDSFALFIDATDSGKDFKLGTTMTDLLYFYVPRAWWPEKPLPFTVSFLPEYAGMDSYGAMAPSLPGELYINFHIIGVILGFLLLGVLMKVCYRGLIKRGLNKSGLLVYIPAAIMAPLLFEGGIDKIQGYILILFPVVLFLWIVRSPRRTGKVYIR